MSSAQASKVHDLESNNLNSTVTRPSKEVRRWKQQVVSSPVSTRVHKRRPKQIIKNSFVKLLTRDCRWAIYDALFHDQYTFQMLDNSPNPLETLAIAVPELKPEIEAFKSKYTFHWPGIPILQPIYYAPHIGHFDPWNTTFSINLKTLPSGPLLREERQSLPPEAKKTPDNLQLAFNRLAFSPSADTLIDLDKKDNTRIPGSKSYLETRSLGHVINFNIDLRCPATNVVAKELAPHPLQILTESIMPYLRFLPNIQNFEVIMSADQLEDRATKEDFGWHHVWDNFWKNVWFCHPGTCCTCCESLPTLKFKIISPAGDGEGELKTVELVMPIVQDTISEDLYESLGHTIDDIRYLPSQWYNRGWDNSAWEQVFLHAEDEQLAGFAVTNAVQNGVPVGGAGTAPAVVGLSVVAPAGTPAVNNALNNTAAVLQTLVNAANTASNTVASATNGGNGAATLQTSNSAESTAQNATAIVNTGGNGGVVLQTSNTEETTTPDTAATGDNGGNGAAATAASGNFTSQSLHAASLAITGVTAAAQALSTSLNASGATATATLEASNNALTAATQALITALNVINGGNEEDGATAAATTNTALSASTETGDAAGMGANGLTSLANSAVSEAANGDNAPTAIGTVGLTVLADSSNAVLSGEIGVDGVQIDLRGEYR